MVWDFWTPLHPHTFSYLRDKCVSCQRKTSTCSCSCYVYRLINQNNKHQLLLSHALNYFSTLASKPKAYDMSNPWWLNFTTLCQHLHFKHHCFFYHKANRLQHSRGIISRLKQTHSWSHSITSQLTVSQATAKHCYDKRQEIIENARCNLEWQPENCQWMRSVWEH